MSEPGGPSPLGRLAALLPDGPRRVAILTPASDARRVQVWLSGFTAADTVHVLAPVDQPEWETCRPPVQVHVVRRGPELSPTERYGGILKEIGPVDVVVDLAQADFDTLGATLRELLYHLRDGGVFVLDGHDLPQPRFRRWCGRWAKRTLAADENVEGMHPDGTQQRQGWRLDSQARHYARTVDSVVAGREVLLVTKRMNHLVRLHDDEVARVLPRREPGITVTELATRPAGRLPSRAHVIAHKPEPSVRPFPASFDYPALHLRHYRGRLVFPGFSTVIAGSALLPESLRWPFAEDLHNPVIGRVTTEFARFRQRLQPARQLPGDYYLVDPQFPGHFGHLMTETLARLWGWQEAKARLPDLKALFRNRHDDGSRPELEIRLLAAAGIPEADLAWTDEPVSVDSLVTATTMWHNFPPYYVHPDLVATWQRLREAMIRPSATGPERLFVSRSERFGRRVCRNTPAVEQLFAGHGFEVVHPEGLDITGQAALFGNATVIAGFAGSAMFNLCYARRLRTTIVLSHSSYNARNEHLYTSLLGGDVHYFWSPADVPQPAEGWSLEAATSDWEFDMAKNRTDLAALLRSL